MRKLIALLVTVFIGQGTAQAQGVVPVTALPSANGPLAGSEVAPIVQGGITKRATASQIASSPSTAAIINASTLTVGSATEIMQAGPQTPIASSAQAIDWVVGTGAEKTNCVNAGGYWSGNQYTAICISRSYTSSQNGANNIPLFLLGQASGTNAAVVPLLSLSRASSNNSSVFGANFICDIDSGITGSKCVGAEIDIEPSSGVTPATGSAGLYINAFNSAIPGAAIQTGGVSGGTFNNGIVLYGLSSSGSGLSAGSGTNMGSLINASNGSYSTSAIILGSTISHGIDFGNSGGGISPFVFGSSSNDLIFQLGLNGHFAVYKNDGVTQLLSIDSNGVISINGTLGVTCSGAPSSLFSAIYGIVTHC